jgi:hypothetical protein
MAKVTAISGGRNRDKKNAIQKRFSPFSYLIPVGPTGKSGGLVIE